MLQKLIIYVNESGIIGENGKSNIRELSVGVGRSRVRHGKLLGLSRVRGVLCSVTRSVTCSIHGN